MLADWEQAAIDAMLDGDTPIEATVWYTGFLMGDRGLRFKDRYGEHSIDDRMNAMDNHKCDKCDRPATTKTEITGGPWVWDGAPMVNGVVTIYGCSDHPSYVQAQQQVQNSESKFVVNPEQSDAGT